MGYRVYILHSRTRDRFYAGFTERGTRRLKEHRQPHEGWTGQVSDWVETFSATVETREEARTLEKKIKARGARRFLDGQ